MEKIVYILGAGFSAPLGLPVMSNFLQKSKDQYFEQPAKYAHFNNIFEQEWDRVHKASNYYETDVFNVEDILSVLEFRARLDNSEDGEQRLAGFLDYLKDVIKFYTPIDKLQQKPKWLFPDEDWNKYIGFVAAILNCSFQETRHPLVSGYDDISHIFNDFERTECQYSVITFNYDLVLESVQTHLKTFHSPRCFRRAIDLDNPRHQIHFAKLHGSIDGEIIPPTWNKGLNSAMLPDWKVAYKVLSEANRIRILGYSLPPTDTYFRYLLRATIIDAPNFKQIDVICKDDDGSVKKSYEFVRLKYPKYRFMSAKIEDYLEEINTNRMENYHEKRFSFSLEHAHEAFFSK